MFWALECNPLPDACTNDLREERLIHRQRKHKFDDRNWLQRLLERERNLIIACIILVIAMNWTEGRYLLYPFMIFSTWVHEMCHGLAAILTGGYIAKLEIFKDGSGLAYTAVSTNWKRGFVASAGYPGTAVTGCIFLLFRRTTLGPTVGTIGIGACILFSCALWVRNTWGLILLLLEGAALILLGWKLPAVILDNLFNFLAATCCLNAVESIHDLFAVGDYYVGGEIVTSSDAHTVAEKWGMNYRFWAFLWLWMSFALTLVGILLAFDARETKWFKSGPTNRDSDIIDAHVAPMHFDQQVIDAQVAPVNGDLYAQSNLPSFAQPNGGESNTAVAYGEPMVAPPKKERRWLSFLRRSGN
jgi:hypothetical protein